MISGGNLSNAIPREGESIFYVEKGNYSELNTLLEKQKAELTEFFSKSDPDLKIRWSKITQPSEQPNKAEIYTTKLNDALINLLYIIPNGALRIASDNPELIITSSNLASIKKEEDTLKLTVSHRSLYESAKKIIAERVEALLNLTRLNISISQQGDYPGWQPNYNSNLLKRAKISYEKVFKKEPIIQTIHAGLETGILKKKFPHIEMISIGPTIEQGHSPKEKLKINTIIKIWDFLKTLLNDLDSSHPL
jgi:dipeptidase D